ncbi:MAG: hypothetical protein JSS50_00470 [Proteobacteria bacterium]|nr:hypothetical protein [Pseudomonadota bacterium]
MQTPVILDSRQVRVLLEKDLVLNQYPEIGKAMSLVICTATTALALMYIPFTQIGAFFVAPYLIHKGIMCGARAADEAIARERKKKEDEADEEEKRRLKELHRKVPPNIISQLCKCLNPTWPFFAAFLTVPLTTILTPICAPLASDILNPGKRLSIIIMRGVAYTAFTENLDRVTAKAFASLSPKLKLEGKSTHGVIWHCETLISFGNYLMLQMFTPTYGLFLGAFFTRFTRSLFFQEYQPEQDGNLTGRYIRVSDAFIRAAIYGATYTGCTELRNVFCVWLEAKITDTAFANFYTQYSVSTTILCSFLADYVYCIVRDLVEFTCKALLYDNNMLFNQHYTTLVAKVDSQLLLKGFALPVLADNMAPDFS